MPPKDVEDQIRGKKDENNKNREMFFPRWAISLLHFASFYYTKSVFKVS